MATPTYIPLATVTLAASSPQVTFTNISQDYSDLVLVANFQHTSAYVNMRMNVNSSGSGYNQVHMLGNGSSALSGTSTGSYFEVGIFSPNTGQNVLSSTEFFDYSATDKHKSLLIRTDNSARATEAIAGRWANTSAITSISLAPASGEIAAGSTFKLFGIHGEAV
tara:strand:+ start:189 stop:683 length:495 start_codon:yes stop_codon:yes gene_type:complete